MSGTTTNKEEEIKGEANSEEMEEPLESGENRQPASSINRAITPLTAENACYNSNFLEGILKQLPSSDLTATLKSMRFVNRGIRDATLKFWRKTAVIEICSHEAYLISQCNLNREASPKGISAEGLLGAVEGNRILKFEKASLTNFSFSIAVSFPLERPYPREIFIWEKFGPQIKYVRLKCSEFKVWGGANGFRNLFELCPNLEELVLHGHMQLKRIIPQKVVIEDDKPVFQALKFKSLTISEHERSNYDCGHKRSSFPFHNGQVPSLSPLLELTPCLQSLSVSCDNCCKSLANTLRSFAVSGNHIKLENLKMILEGNEIFGELLDYVQRVVPPLQKIDLRVILEGAMHIPLKIVKICKDSVKYLTLSLVAMTQIYVPNYEEWSGCRFGALRNLNLKMEHWGEGSLGGVGGCIFPVLTRLEIKCIDFRGMWLNILSTSTFPSLTYLKISFAGSRCDRFKTFDFGGFKGMPRLEEFSFKVETMICKGVNVDFLVACYPLTPYKMVNKHFHSSNLQDFVEPGDNLVRLDKLTDFCYPARFTPASLLLISKWFPGIKNLEIGADVESVPAIFSLFSNAQAITLFVKQDVTDELLEPFKNGFQGTLRTVRVMGI